MSRSTGHRTTWSRSRPGTPREALATATSRPSSAPSLSGPDIETLIPERPPGGACSPCAAGGHYPINHLVVVRDDVLRAHPGLAADIFDAFARAKRVYLDRLRAGIAAPDAGDRLYGEVLALTDADPLPYGIGPNREVLEELMSNAVQQQILAEPIPVETLFAEGTLELTG